MNRFVLLVVALVFTFTTAVIADDKTTLTPEEKEKVSDVSDLKKSEEEADQKSIKAAKKVEKKDGQKVEDAPAQSIYLPE